MSIALKCDQCGQRYALKNELAGKSVKCRGCGKVLRAPHSPRLARAPEPAFPPDLDLYGLDELAVGDESDLEFEDEAPSSSVASGSAWSRSTEVRGKGRRKASPGRSSFTQYLFGSTASVILVTGYLVFAVYNRVQERNRAATAAARLTAQLARPITPPDFPDPGPARILPGGVRFHEIRLGPEDPAPESPGHRGKLWLYLPDGEHEPGSLACIVITGAGSNLITGMDLADGDRPEHLPYAHAGMAVLAYELDGALPEQRDDQAIVAGCHAFLGAQAGLVNARNALDYLASKVPEVDPERIYAVGHSSAATMALVLTENEPRIKACVAFAPVVDMAMRYRPADQAQLAALIPGIDAFFSLYNPRLHEDAINCPLLLFHAQDDSNVPASESIECKARLEQLGKPVTLALVPTGDHYDSMIRQGIPRAIAWLKELDQPN